MKQHTHRKEFVRGIKNGIPIAMGYLAVAFTLGIAAKKAGITAFQAGLTSFGLHASAGEYICFTLIAAHAGLIEMVVMEAGCKCKIFAYVMCIESENPSRHTNLEKAHNGIFYNR